MHRWAGGGGRRASTHRPRSTRCSTRCTETNSRSSRPPMARDRRCFQPPCDPCHFRGAVPPLPSRASRARSLRFSPRVPLGAAPPGRWAQSGRRLRGLVLSCFRRAGFYGGAAYHVNVRNLCAAVRRHTVETIVRNRVGAIGCASTPASAGLAREERGHRPWSTALRLAHGAATCACAPPVPLSARHLSFRRHQLCRLCVVVLPCYCFLLTCTFRTPSARACTACC